MKESGREREKKKNATTHREQVPITPRQLRRIDDRESADPTLGRDVAQPRLAPRAAVPARLQLAVTGAHARIGGGQEGGEAHLHKVGGGGGARR